MTLELWNSFWSSRGVCEPDRKFELSKTKDFEHRVEEEERMLPEEASKGVSEHHQANSYAELQLGRVLRKSLCSNDVDRKSTR